MLLDSFSFSHLLLVSDLSPFAIAKASATTSAQTGEYAGTYIIMVAVALVAAGAVFAIRAKKASN